MHLGSAEGDAALAAGGCGNSDGGSGGSLGASSGIVLLLLLVGLGHGDGSATLTGETILISIRVVAENVESLSATGPVGNLDGGDTLSVLTLVHISFEINYKLKLQN